ncbi:MAG: hypothetical protein WDN24_11695 [Sphingomonas sp.]
MKQALLALIVGTLLSGLAAAYAATIQNLAGAELSAIEAHDVAAAD